MELCVFLWLPLQPTGKNEGVVWVKGSHLWNKLFLTSTYLKMATKLKETNVLLMVKNTNYHQTF